MNTDLERELRDLLSAEAGSAPPPHEVRPAIRKTRRRQIATAAGALMGVATIAVGVLVGVRLIDDGRTGTPLVEPTMTATMNGVRITIPESWQLIDPDEAGLNGPDPTLGFPRIILALAPFEAGELFGCPGMAANPHTFLMTLQEEPLALAGPRAMTWPVELEELDAGTDEVACFPGWSFLRAGWTSAGRSFEARLGLAPDVSDADREALSAAFASLTFEPATSPVGSVIIATGEAAGEAWELIASRQPDGLGLSLQSETFGTGGSGVEPSDALALTSHVFGEGESAEQVVFAAVRSEVARIGVRVVDDDELLIEVLDVPREIDPSLDAFVFTLPADLGGIVNAYDEAGNIVASGTLHPGTIDPGAPPALPDEIVPEHGGTAWGLYLAVAESLEDPVVNEWIARAEELGYTPAVGSIECDDGAATELGIPSGWSGVAIYFATRDDAETAHEALAVEDREPYGIARVTTYCLD